MTAEQLEEMLGKVMQIKAAETYEQIMNAFPGPPIVEYLCRENAHLTRRALAAEELVEAGNVMADALKGNYIVPGSAAAWDAAVTACREASK